MVAALQRPVAIRRNGRDGVHGGRGESRGEDARGGRRERAEAALLPLPHERAHGVVVFDRGSSMRESEPPAAALAAAPDRPSRRRAATVAERRPEARERADALAADVDAAVAAERAAPREDEIEQHRLTTLRLRARRLRQKSVPLRSAALDSADDSGGRHRPTRQRVKTIHLDEIDPTRVGESLWKPIRSTLGINAFGINAYVAERTGDTLFEEHDETEAGAGRQRHEELYLVLSGRATFTVDGREIDARAGTFVFLGDPAEQRAARAAEPQTTVLAIGAPAGEGYEVAPWEYWFRLQRAHEQDRLEDARAVVEEGLARYPDDARLRREVSERRAQPE